MHWLFCTLLLVLAVKYYTTKQAVRLRKRLRSVREGFLETKTRFQQIQERQTRIKAEEALYEERLRRMKEIIEDIRIRLRMKDEEK